MNTNEKIQHISKELEMCYSFCNVVPTDQHWKEFLSLQKDDQIKSQLEKVTAATAFRELWIFKHYIVRKLYAAQVDQYMRYILNAELYELYFERYCKKYNFQS